MRRPQPNDLRDHRPTGRRAVLPEGDAPHRGKAVDINMLFLLGGRERTLVEFSDLLNTPGFSPHASGNESGEVGWIEARPNERS